MKKAMLMTALLFAAALVLTSAARASENETGQVPMSAMTAAQLEQQGDDLRAQKDYTEAIHYYEAAVKKDPSSSMLYNKLGIVQLRINRLDEAEANLQKSVKLNSKNDHALNNIGVIAFERKNYSRAAKYYKKALAIDETNAVYHSNLGTAWFEQKKDDRAMAEYYRAIELDPEIFMHANQVGSVARIAGAEDRAKYEFMLAKMYAQHGDLENSIHWLQKAKEDGYTSMQDVYKDGEFAKLRQDPRLTQIVPPGAGF